MGKTSAEVKNRYAKKVYDRLNIVVKKGKKDEYKAFAEKQGKSLNAFVIELIEREVEK